MAGYLPPQPMDIELASHFECPVCFDYVLPPIQQCQSGHLICNSCRLKLSSNTCPTCRSSLEGAAIRNLALEKIASDIYFPCKYATKGCHHMMKWTDKSSHQETCGYQIPKCPISSICSFEGSVLDIITHIKADHALVEKFGENLEWVIGVNDFTWRDSDSEFYVQLMRCQDQHFLVIIRKVDIGVMFYEYQYQGLVQLIGNSAKADGFEYRMELGRGRNKSNWEGVTLSITENAEDAFATGNCFYIHPNTALLLANHESGGSELVISVFITKSQDPMSQDWNQRFLV